MTDRIEPDTDLLDSPVRVKLEDGVVYEGTYIGIRFDEIRLGCDARSIRNGEVTPCPRGVHLPRNRFGKAILSVAPLASS
jgi:hypothetical protein